MIEIKSLTKRFGDLDAVRDLTLHVRPGEIFGFLGPNGAGKTTTVKVLSGLIYPTSGSVKIGGYDIVSQSIEAKKIMALVPDEPFVYPKLTGREFMYFIGDLYGIAAARQQAEIPRLLELFELGKWEHELLESYSHGMRQKLVIASVLLREPKVVLLDEPMVGLDPKSARMVKNIFQEMAQRGAAIFMCTHILEIAERLCHRIGIMYEGRMIEVGTLSQLRERSGSPLIDDAGKKINLEDIFLSLTAEPQYTAV